MKVRETMAVAIASVMLSVSAAAEITVQIVPPNGGDYDIDDAGNGKKTVIFNRSQGVTDAVIVNIRGDSDDEIHEVIVNNSIYVTLLSIRGPGASDRIASVDSITEVGGQGTVVLQELRLSGDLGDDVAMGDDAIEVDSITLADVEGDVLDGIRSLNGTIATFIISGDLKEDGNFAVANGSIELLEVGGTIGALADEININVEGSLYELKATAIHANIHTDTDDDGDGSVFRIETTGGNFTGSLDTVFLTTDAGVADERIEINGDCTAALSFSEDIRCPVVIHGDLASNGSITVGSELWVGQATEGSITIDEKLLGTISIGTAGGLDGQIVINGDNNVYSPWENGWTGTVSVNGTALSPDGAYTNTPSDLGAGAVGLARFTLWKQACTPIHNADLAGQPPNNRVELFHYGPVQPFDAAYTPSLPMVKVERRNYDESGSWTIVTNSFDSEFDANKPNTLIVKPATGDWGSGYQYRLSHNATPNPSSPGYLKCVDVSSSPAVLVYEYLFKIDD